MITMMQMSSSSASASASSLAPKFYYSHNNNNKNKNKNSNGYYYHFYYKCGMPQIHSMSSSSRSSIIRTTKRRQILRLITQRFDLDRNLLLHRLLNFFSENTAPRSSSSSSSARNANSIVLRGITGHTSPSPPQCSFHKQDNNNAISRWVEIIRGMFQSMDLGEISVSAYDTAWVGLVPSLDDPTSPQFPKSLDWIMKNQFPDGSWGNEDLFLAYDRVCSTLACVVALKTWNIGHDKVQRGVDFINKMFSRIQLEANDYMPIGFEVVFPTLLEDAKTLGLDLSYDSSIVTKFTKERTKKLERLPLELIYSRPTTLLHSMEGLHRTVDWKRLLKLQTKSGSFLNSPASTACALKYTKNKKCLDYLNLVLKKFDNGAVPNVYPVDLFERLWMVDQLERLGISRYFKCEIKQCLDYVYKHWTNKGISWSSDANIVDGDDTAMAFRLLRLHGYNVSPEVFENFKTEGSFFCFEGQTSQSISGLFNLYRASQVMFPNESILKEMNLFTKSFLSDKQKKNTIKDKWVITKSLKGEVEYALKHPWSQSLPRVEARHYIDQYGVDDVWIGKSLYRMFFVNNQVFLDLAKADYNLCQSYHKKELKEILSWNKLCQFDKLNFARQKPIECYFSASATLFAPEFSRARVVWTTTCILTTLIDDYFDVKGALDELVLFYDAIQRWDPQLMKTLSNDGKILFLGLYKTINDISKQAFIAQRRDISSHLMNFWIRWIKSILVEAKWKHAKYSPSLEEYMCNAKISIALEPIVQSTLFFLDELVSEEQIMHEDCLKIMDILSIIGRLNNDIQGYKRENKQGKLTSLNIYLKESPKLAEKDAIEYFKSSIDENMTLLIEEYLRDSTLPTKCKLLHLNMAKILNLFYNGIDGLSSKTAMSQYVNDVLFRPII
uniref:Ent-kaurene synthase n=1 Tax=Azolla filiculoides TaxID=84609 RepID=A0A8U0DA92_AZOFI|nr:ent-kaurene synthase [Azolla filiculoides]